MKKTTILLVDYEEAIFKTIKHLFPEKRYNILYCRDIHQAYEILLSQKVDLVILELFLSNGSGIRLLEMIKENGISAKTIILSVSDTAQSATQTMKLGAIDYFTKPFNTKDFVTMISRYSAHL